VTAPTIVKIGGSILRSAADFVQVARWLEERLRSAATWAVVSAAHGVTDRLENLNEAEAATLVAFHAELAGIELPKWLVRDLEESRETARTGRTGPLRSWGERASAYALQRRLSETGVEAPIVELSARSRPPDARAAVVPGFYLRDRNGVARTLPRGGSDISAVLVARLVGAREVRLWKDAGGLRTGEGIVSDVDVETLLTHIGVTIRPLHPAAARIARHCGISLVLEDPTGRARPTRIHPRRVPSIAA
jgi:aspartate kinase